MYLVAHKRAELDPSQWILRIAVSPADYDNISVGDTLYAPNGRAGIISKKVSGETAPPIANSPLTREIWASFAAIPADRLSVYWENGTDFQLERPPTIAEEVEDRARKVPQKVKDAARGLWEGIPTWVKVGGAVLGGVIVVRLAEEIIP